MYKVMCKFFVFAALFSLMQMPSTAMADDKKSVIAVIVARNQNVDELKLAANQLSLVYWRKQLYWPKGQRIKPVNLSTEHALRLQFSQKILGGAPKSQIDYWNGQYFNGVLPPYSVNSEEAVLRYVAQTKGAIGYVNACAVDNRVQAVFWLINDQVTANEPENLDCK
jgi:ABC-type phosphate transport system substrate-binding protein